MSIWIKLLLGLAAVYGLVAVAAYFGQRKLMYFPDRQRVQPSEAGLPDVEERVLKTPDGERVIAWYGKARPGQPTLLYFHGNGGSLAVRAERIRRFMNEGWGVYMMTYRGYGGSTGFPTEVNNVADARLAHGALVHEGVPPSSIILYGESLGTAVATRIAVERPSAGLILETPYTSIVDIAALRYPYLPARRFLLDRYQTVKYIKNVKVPVLILHGEHDQVVPVAMGREIARLANEPKRLVVFPEGRHSNIYVDGNNAIAAVRQWIEELGR
jgi:pimeloyl-ACP methyl ester carboxylesterase